MDEKWYEILRQADRDMYNNNRREEYKSYHLKPYYDAFDAYHVRGDLSEMAKLFAEYLNVRLDEYLKVLN